VTGGRCIYEASIVVFGGCFAVGFYGRLWPERAVVFAAQEWDGCYAPGRKRRCSAAVDQSAIITAGQYGIAIDYDVGVYAEATSR
jgi:hypothetical protein